MAYCALRLVERGALELDAPVARYWPEFAQGGKEAATVRHVLAHQAGVIALREAQPPGLLYDWSATVAALAAEPAWWEPGTRHGEHALFYGHLVGELVRRVDGRSLGTFLREETGLDFHIGVRPGDRARIAPLTDPGGRWRSETQAQATELMRLALENPPGLLDVQTVNGDAWRAAEIPAVNGHGSARAIAAFYDALLDDPMLPEATAINADGIDVLLEQQMRWGLGVGLYEGGDFGMGGIGGSLGFANAERSLAFAYVTTRMGGHDRAEAVERALLEVLG